MNKIILSAYACHPYKGSEPGIGWGWLTELSKYNQVWVLFYAGQGQKEAVEESVSLLPQKENIHLEPITVPKLFKHHLYILRYEIWQKKAYKHAKNIIDKNYINVIHHVTIAAWWNCGYLWKLKVPFILGPISGFQKIPLRAIGFLRGDGILYELLRILIVNIGRNLNWHFKLAAHKSNTIFCSNEATYNYFAIKKINKNIKLLLDTGIKLNDIRVKTKNPSIEKNIILIWSGILNHRKNFGLLFKALKVLSANINWKLIVLGDGKLIRYWKSKVNKSRLNENIIFMGKIPIQKVKEFYENADVFVFPSLREASGTVILEAMSSGLPVIALRLNGAITLLDDKSGILIDVTNNRQMIEDFANAIIKLYENVDLRKLMGNNARERALRLFTWEARGKYMNELYKEIISKT